MTIIKDPKDVLDLSLDELWAAVQLLDQEDLKEFTEEIEAVKFGVDVKFPIYYIINEWYENHPSSKRVSIKGYGKSDIVKFHDEIEERKKVLRNILIMTIDESVTESRV